MDEQDTSAREQSEAVLMSISVHRDPLYKYVHAPRHVANARMAGRFDFKRRSDLRATKGEFESSFRRLRWLDSGTRGAFGESSALLLSLVASTAFQRAIRTFFRSAVKYIRALSKPVINSDSSRSRLSFGSLRLLAYSYFASLFFSRRHRPRPVFSLHL